MIEFKELYVQSGALAMLNCIPVLDAAKKPTSDIFGGSFVPLSLYCKGSKCHIYFERELLNDLAKKAIKKLNEDNGKVYSKFKESAKRIEAIGHEAETKPIEPHAGFKKAWDELVELWRWSAFIDAFDGGEDFKQIETIAKKHNLTLEEVQTLTTPTELSYLQDIELALINALQTKNTKELLKEFYWIRTDFAHFGKFQEKEAKEEIEKISGENWKGRLDNITNYVKNVKQKQEKILKEKNLVENPLWLYNKLVFWRDERKRFNFIGLHALGIYAQAIMREHNLQEYLYLVVTPEEYFANKLPTESELEKRFNIGAVVEGFEDHTNYLFGKEAVKEFNRLQASRHSNKLEIEGQIGCLGRVIAEVSVIKGLGDFEKFKDGNILVTGMTRPEFVPLMKRARGIITDEGGITCHAAIVSRELNKPCIIGTHNATKLLKDGDLVELDAFHGRVKKMNS